MDSEAAAISSRPASRMDHPASRPASALAAPAETMQTITPQTVKAWRDQQASLMGTYGRCRTTQESPRSSHRQPRPCVLVCGEQSHSPDRMYDAGCLGDSQAFSTHPHCPQRDSTMHEQLGHADSYSGPSLRDAQLLSSLYDHRTPSNSQLDSPLTWSPESESGQTDEGPPSLTAATMHLAAVDDGPQAILSDLPQAVKIEDNDATIKRHSFNPTQVPSNYFSDESSLDYHSATDSPAPIAPMHGSSSVHWRRAPLPFPRSTSPAIPQLEIDTQSTSPETDAHVQTFRLGLASPAALEPAITPQVTLSPAFLESSASFAHPCSPDEDFSRLGNASHQPEYTVDYGQERSVSPHSALLEPMPIHAEHRYAFENSLNYDEQQYATSLAYRDRHYSSTSSSSSAGLSAFRVQYMPYRDSCSPLGSIAGSYHSQSADEGGFGSQAGGCWSAEATRSSSGLSFNAESSSSGDHFFFAGMQITSPDDLPDRYSPAISSRSSSQMHYQPYQETSPMHHPELQRSTSLSVARRPSSLRHYSYHPYHLSHRQYIPEPALYRREDYHPSATHAVSRLAPDLTYLQDFDASMYLRTPSPLDQPGKWVIPTEEEVRLVAAQYKLPYGKDVGILEAQSERLADNSGSSAPYGDVHQDTVVPWRNTSSGSRGAPIAQLFPPHEALAENDPRNEAWMSEGTSNDPLADQTHARLDGAQESPDPADLDAVGKAPASGKYQQSRITGIVVKTGHGLVPLHMLPTKPSRGRRPVVSPELNLDPTVDSATASTMQQVTFTGLTKTGKPKKIFVCRVPGCDKCFRRSEHLKRHIRSIHTNDKRKLDISTCCLLRLSCLQC